MRLEPIIFRALSEAIDKEHPDRMEGRIYSIGTKDSFLRPNIARLGSTIAGFDGQIFAVVDIREALNNTADKSALIANRSDMLKSFFAKLQETDD